MTISDLQRRRTEERIRAAIDRLLRGQIPPGGGCDIKTLAREAAVSRASLYRTYHHLKTEFEQRLTTLRNAGHLPDPRAAQIVRLTDENTRLRQRLAERDQIITELTELRTAAMSRLAAQHDEILALRAALSNTTNVRPLRGHAAASTDGVNTADGAPR